MNLLIYSHYFAPSIGGVETIVRSLAIGISELRSRNGEQQFNVTVVTETAAGGHDDEALPFRIIRQPRFFKLWQLIRTSDVIHVAGPALLPIFLAWLSRKPFVIEHHTYQAICPNGVLLHQPDRSICPGYFQAGRYGECVSCLQSEVSTPRAIAQLLLMFPRYRLSRAATINIAVTSHVRDRHKLPRTSVVYHGIEKLLPNPDALIPSRRLCIAYVGRLVAEKGVPVLLEASKLLKNEGHDFEVRIIGDGTERSKFEDIIQRENLSSCITITGFLSGDALANALRDVKVVVMPSVWEETAGLAAMEQMMRGRLVIASDVGGLDEVVSDAGMRFAPGSAESLANCMRSVIMNLSLIDSFGQRALKRALDLFGRQRMIEDHARVYKDVVQ
jgi:glycogen(starch) synthase